MYLAELLIDVFPKVMQSVRHEMRAERGELTITQFRMLANVRQGVCNNKILGEKLGVSEAAVSRMLDLLVQENLIAKKIDEEDRRNKVLTLTASGKKLYEKITQSARERMSVKLQALEENDRETVIRGLEVLQKNLNILKQ